MEDMVIHHRVTWQILSLTWVNVYLANACLSLELRVGCVSRRRRRRVWNDINI